MFCIVFFNFRNKEKIFSKINTKREKQGKMEISHVDISLCVFAVRSPFLLECKKSNRKMNHIFFNVLFFTFFFCISPLEKTIYLFLLF